MSDASRLERGTGKGALPDRQNDRQMGLECTIGRHIRPDHEFNTLISEGLWLRCWNGPDFAKALPRPCASAKFSIDALLADRSLRKDLKDLEV